MSLKRPRNNKDAVSDAESALGFLCWRQSCRLQSLHRYMQIMPITVAIHTGGRGANQTERP